MIRISRRQFGGSLALSAGSLAASRMFGAPAILEGTLPQVVNGVASGDVNEGEAIVWALSDRAARMVVEWSQNETFSDLFRRIGPVTGPEADFTAKLLLRDLPPGRRIHYRVGFEDRQGGLGPMVPGSLVTPSRSGEADVRFAWSGDTCGQGWGIDVDRGGMRTYDAILRQRPDFFVHSGDTIYADNPMQAEVKLPDGGTWRNLVTPEKSKVAETLDEFRGNHRYNLLDANVRRFNAHVPVFAQWDDHEVRNNWYPGQRLPAAAGYGVRDLDVLAARSRQAFFEYQPIREHPDRRIYRRIRRGPLCELFFLDLRTFRGPNSPNRQPIAGPDTAFMGTDQLAWLKEELVASRAVWKIVCSDMPLSLLVRDGADSFEAFANGDGMPLGRELEVASLLRHLKGHGVRNVVWLTADVHYAASHHYDPSRAQFTEFDPFWEFVSGPLHAGTFGPGTTDNTFGPEVRFSTRKAGDAPTGPWSPHQFFGTVGIDAKSRVATVTHFNRDGDRLWSIDLPPAGA
jgi:alkaline phosphatase D